MARFKMFGLPVVLLSIAGSTPLGAMTTEEQREYLAEFQQILPDVPSFREWLVRRFASEAPWRAAISSRARRFASIHKRG